MPWSLVLSVVPIVTFMGCLLFFEHRSAKKHKKNREESRAAIAPIAKIADSMYRRRYGKCSDELVEVFPDLKVVK